jgi:hypothetical protein
MDLMGFGRRLSPETRARMAEGAAWHVRFQDELARSGTLLAREEVVRDPALGVSGRMDAVVRGTHGPAVVEYKTVSAARFDEIVAAGVPPVPFWAQLHLYLAVTGYPSGLVVVDERDPAGRRLVFRTGPSDPWRDWVLERVRLARGWAEERRLPDREPGPHCLTCDRWERCYRSEAERDEAVRTHPVWEPRPALPPLVPADVADTL